MDESEEEIDRLLAEEGVVLPDVDEGDGDDEPPPRLDEGDWDE